MTLFLAAITAAVSSLRPDHVGPPGSAPATPSTDEGRPIVAQPGTSVASEIGDPLNTAYVERDRLESVDVVLRRHHAPYQGRIGHQRMEITMEGSHIGGLIGDRPISLRAERARGHLHVDGMFGARAIALTVHPPSLRGKVGPCRYDLSVPRDSYEGHVFCGGYPRRMSFTLPVALAARGDVELSALLAALLVR